MQAGPKKAFRILSWCYVLLIAAFVLTGVVHVMAANQFESKQRRGATQMAFYAAGPLVAYIDQGTARQLQSYEQPWYKKLKEGLVIVLIGLTMIAPVLKPHAFSYLISAGGVIMWLAIGLFCAMAGV